jgi:tRNA(Ile)-lysidine synthase
MSLIDRVRRTLQRHRLASPSTRVVAALSGGPDSTALVHLLRELDAAHELRLVAIAHLNHQLRDAASTDEQFSAKIAADLDLPLSSERIDVRRIARSDHRSIEDAAHIARTGFFERTVAIHRADVMAVGHTRDDQAETVLLRLVRGAGTRGLSAMHPRNGVVIRPLLDCSRPAIRAFLTERQIPFVHDASNDDVGIPRNRVRAELLPLLAERFNPRIVEVLAAEAVLARADQQYLDALAEQWCAGHLVREEAGTWKSDAAALAAQPPAVAWRVLHKAMSQAARGRLIGFDDVARAWEVVAESAPGFDAPGHRVERVGGYVVLSTRPAGSAGHGRAVTASRVLAFSHPLPVPGEVALPEIGCVISAEVAISAQHVSRAEGTMAVVPKDKVAGGLAVRNRRPGDRLMPSSVGHRKLQDLLVDRKVPRAERDRVPIVVDVHDKVVWVAGHALDRDFQVSDPVQAVVILRLKAVGGSC